MNSTTNNTPAPDHGEPWRVMTYADGGVGTREARPIIEDLRLSHRAVACVNACAGMADPAAEIASMREAIREAHGALSYLLSDSVTFLRNTAIEKAENSITKLQPFLQ